MDEDEDGYSMEREQADFEQAELKRLGRLASNLRKKGICVHGWRQEYSLHMPEEYRGRILPGLQLCLDCGKLATEEELNTECDQYLY